MKCQYERRCNWSDEQPDGRWECRTCGALSETKPVSEKRRQQNREAQRKHRAGKRADEERRRAQENDAADAQRLWDENKELRRQLAIAHAEILRLESQREPQGSISGLVKLVGRGNLLKLVHPDTNGGCEAATKATRYILENC